jgi:predicted dehydrogenase
MKDLNRREFLGVAAAGAMSGHLQASGSGSEEKLRIGLIGSGWFGGVLMKAAFQVGGVEVLAISDVDTEHLQNTAAEIEKAQGKKPTTFKHHQELLETPGLQAVFIASPPQWHALQFIDACAKKLDIYCEKPLSYDIREGRAMIEAARKADNVVQIGFQRRQGEALRQAARHIQAGNAGRIVQVDVQIHYQAGLKDTTPQAPPASLDWDLWCGPAPKLPYSPNIGHFNWRLEAAYGNGHLVDWGIHWIDAIRTVLKETTPRAVHAVGGNYQLKSEITTPDTLTAHFEFESCPVVWRHRLWGAAEYVPELNNGALFYGEKETILVTDSRWVIVPRERGAERKVMEPGGNNEVQSRHVADFLQAVRTRTQPSCRIEDAYQSTTTVHLGAIAYQSGGRVEWDRQREEISGNASAARLLKREYRSPWKHPG